MSEKMKKFLGIIAFLGLPTPCTVFSGYMHHKKILKGFFQHIRKFTKQNFNKIFFELCPPLVPLFNAVIRIKGFSETASIKCP